MSRLQLQPLAYTRLQHHELAQFMVRTLKELSPLKATLAKDQVTAQLLAELEAALPAFQASLDQVRGSEKTATISELDAYRDDDLQALFDSIKPFKNARRAEDKAAYTHLHKVFARYKDAKRSNYEEESHKIQQLLNQLVLDYADEVTALSLDRTVANLTQSQANFEESFAARSADQKNKVSYDAKQLRRDLQAPYQMLCDYVVIVARVKKNDTTFTEVLATLNNSRKYFADVLARR